MRVRRKSNTVNQLIFAAIRFRVFLFMDIFAPIYFCGLNYWTMQEQYTACLYGHFAAIYFREMLFLANVARTNRSQWL